MRRLMVAAVAAIVALAAMGGPAYACGGLIGPNGAVNLVRTSTLAGYHDGVEHYITAFEFLGAGGQFGSLIPLPGVPTSVEKGGAWTLQRLIRETEPPVRFRALRSAFQPASADAQILMTVKIDALDITVLKGGAEAVGKWAKDHGFRLPPDAPEVLDFYAQRSPIFLAAVFDGDAALARGQSLGDGTPVHISIPTENPWVPLRILALGKQGGERVEADVYLLTDRLPTLLPKGRAGIEVTHNAPASAALLDDLRSDRGMSWVPTESWLTKVRVDGRAADITYDLAIDASGRGAPSRVAAGLEMPKAPVATTDPTLTSWAAALVLAYLIGALLLTGRLALRPARNR